MIFLDFFKALSQIGDPRFLKVLGKGVGLTIALLIGFYVTFVVLITKLGFTAWIAETVGISTGWATGALGIGGLFIMLALSVFLMVPVASAITSLYLDDVASAVEAHHYPDHPSGKTVPFMEGLAESAQFLGVILAANMAALVVVIFIPILGPIPFWVVNGYLLGREYFTIIARRHLGQDAAFAMFRTHQSHVWFAGLLMAIPLTIPLVNLLVPTLGAATFTHLFHRLNR
ncbi:MAG: EI24 domain-containing protein [Planktomarina sp.]